MRYEDIFSGEGLDQKLGFLNLPKRPDIKERKRMVFDNYRYISNEWNELKVIDKHKEVLALEQKIGYDINEINEVDLMKRYLGIQEVL